MNVNRMRYSLEQHKNPYLFILGGHINKLCALRKANTHTQRIKRINLR